MHLGITFYIMYGIVMNHFESVDHFTSFGSFKLVRTILKVIVISGDVVSGKGQV